MAATLELVTFRITGKDKERFVEVNAPLNDWLKRQPGFVSRHLSEKEDGSYVDIVFWESHESAISASEKLMQEMAQCEAMQMIDPLSIGMSHASIRLSCS